MADLGDVYIHVFILKEVWVQGSTWSLLRLHTRSLMLKHAQPPWEKQTNKQDSILYICGERGEIF